MAKSSQSKSETRRRVVKPAASRVPRAGATVATGTGDPAQLAAELAVARARIAELEAAHAAVLDRIAWAIDSLHTLIEDASD